MTGQPEVDTATVELRAGEAAERAAEMVAALDAGLLELFGPLIGDVRWLVGTVRWLGEQLRFARLHLHPDGTHDYLSTSCCPAHHDHGNCIGDCKTCGRACRCVDHANDPAGRTPRPPLPELMRLLELVSGWWRSGALAPAVPSAELAEVAGMLEAAAPTQRQQQKQILAPEEP